MSAGKEPAAWAMKAAMAIHYEYSREWWESKSSANKAPQYAHIFEQAEAKRMEIARKIEAESPCSELIAGLQAIASLYDQGHANHMQRRKNYACEFMDMGQCARDLLAKHAPKP